MRPRSSTRCSKTAIRASDMVQRYWWAVVRRLDRPGLRWLLVVPGSIWVSRLYGAPCLVYWRDGMWIHRYRGTKIPHAELGRAAPPDVFTRGVRDLFLYAYEPGRGDVVFDIGAGTGAETLMFSRLVGAEGRVVAIEAHPRTFERLVALCRTNALTNVTALDVLLTDFDGEATISDDGNHVRNARADEGIRVRARRLDSLAHELELDRIDLLKMNIEGAETDALQGLGALAERTRHVVVSCHDFLGVPTKEAVSTFLKEHGFELTTREDAPDPWTRDYVYGTKPAAKPTR
jgi:FkbM family methyltransferase